MADNSKIEWLTGPDGSKGASWTEGLSATAKSHYYAPGAPSADQIVARFWSNVEKSDQGCWSWCAGRFSSSLRYGQFRVFKKKIKAHRFAYELANGPIPGGMRVLHRCDNPICVNPAHLFIGTDGDNIRDRDAKNRLRHGENHGMAKLTAAQVLAIRASSETCAQLSVRFGVGPGSISRIRLNKTWRRLDG